MFLEKDNKVLSELSIIPMPIIARLLYAIPLPESLANFANDFC
jgi:hypothetical protein